MPNLTQYITPEMVKIASELLDWSRKYLATPHAEIQRPIGSQVVCPFVKGSIDNNAYYMRFHPEVTGESPEEIEEIICSYIEDFKELGPHGIRNEFKKGLLVVFPNIPDAETTILDGVHANIKTTFIRHGLMIGQFHKNCEEKGVYNPKFNVSISPYPLVAIRHMAIHDILFIKGNLEWFEFYNAKFGHRFENADSIEGYNKHLIGQYQDVVDSVQELVP